MAGRNVSSDSEHAVEEHDLTALLKRVDLVRRRARGIADLRRIDRPIQRGLRACPVLRSSASHHETPWLMFSAPVVASGATSPQTEPSPTPSPVQSRRASLLHPELPTAHRNRPEAAVRGNELAVRPSALRAADHAGRHSPARPAAARASGPYLGLLAGRASRVRDLDRGRSTQSPLGQLGAPTCRRADARSVRSSLRRRVAGRRVRVVIETALRRVHRSVLDPMPHDCTVQRSMTTSDERTAMPDHVHARATLATLLACRLALAALRRILRSAPASATARSAPRRRERPLDRTRVADRLAVGRCGRSPASMSALLSDQRTHLIGRWRPKDPGELVEDVQGLVRVLQRLVVGPGEQPSAALLPVSADTMR